MTCFVVKVLGRRPSVPAPPPAAAGASAEVSAEELQRRTEFLRSQRDRLLQMKKEEREKLLVEAERSQTAKQRPKSARAARSAFGKILWYSTP
jgi:hypothetical protein